CQGVVLCPTGSSLRTCLDYARGLVVYHQLENFGRPPGCTIWLNVVNGLDASTWFWLAVMLYSGSCASGSFWWTSGRGLSLYVAILFFAVAGGCAGIVGCQVWDFHEDQIYPVVVVAENEVILRNGNGLSYSEKFAVPVNRGTEARLLFVRGDWLQVELLTGEAGWIPRKAVVLG